MNLKFDFMDNEHEKKGMMLAVAILVMGIIATALFWQTGGSILFYLFGLIAICCGFYMMYHLSKEPHSETSEARAPANSRKKYRKRS